MRLASLRMVLSVAALALAGGPTTFAQGEPGPPRVSDVKLQDALAGKRVTLVLVKDFMKVQNTAGLLQSVEFPRYFPAVDEEQIVLGRWLEARTAGGTLLPIDCPATAPDHAGNLIQTLRINPFPPRQAITVTITTLVARRERPAPSGPFSIPKPEEYPADVRLYLASTPMIDAKHSVVRETAAAILVKTRDPIGIAAEIARLAKARTYLPSGDQTEDLPLSSGVLKHGGSCCASAVAAAAVLRACGIPAQVTYCPPPSYVHGIVRFWVQGYGWIRMDATSGSGQFPLVQGEHDLTLVRLFDTPIGMEEIPIAYAWPYQNNDPEGEYRFFSEGTRCDAVRMHVDENGALPFVQKPFPHLEPGSWSALLGSEAIEGAWEDWKSLVETSRAAAAAGTIGPFEELGRRIPATKGYCAVAGTWSMAAEPSGTAKPGVR